MTESPRSTRRWSWVVTLVSLNFALWQLGAFFNSFGGSVDRLGATLCQATWKIAPWMIVGGLCYSPIRRFLLPVRTWDFYGPAIAILSYVVMTWQVHWWTRY